MADTEHTGLAEQHVLVKSIKGKLSARHFISFNDGLSSFWRKTVSFRRRSSSSDTMEHSACARIDSFRFATSIETSPRRQCVELRQKSWRESLLKGS